MGLPVPRVACSEIPTAFLGGSFLLAKSSPYLIQHSNGTYKQVAQGVFCAYIATGLLLRVSKKLAVIREGYYCFEDQSTGQLRFVCKNTETATGVRGASWKDGLWAQLPPFPAQIDIDYLMRENHLSRDEALAFVRLESVSAMYKAQDSVLNLR